MTLHDFQDRLDILLRNAGCKHYTAAKAISDAADCWREIHADTLKHGGDVDEPFFNYIATEEVGIFTFYFNNIDFYVICGDEWDFRSRFDSLAMTDLEAARAIIAADFQKSAPDLTIPSALKRACLSSFSDGST